MYDEEKEKEQRSDGGEKRKIILKSLLIKIAPFLIVALLVGGGIFYLVKTKPEIFGLSKGGAAVQAQAQAEIDELVKEVGKVMSLPTDERPTVATVTDMEKVKDQPFFKNAKNGDKVIIYSASKKAILYRPSEKKIIEVGLVNIGGQAQQEESGNKPSTATPTPAKKTILSTPTPEASSETP
jgi:hypothetical protein